MIRKPALESFIPAPCSIKIPVINAQNVSPCPSLRILSKIIPPAPTGNFLSVDRYFTPDGFVQQ